MSSNAGPFTVHVIRPDAPADANPDDVHYSYVLDEPTLAGAMEIAFNQCGPGEDVPMITDSRGGGIARGEDGQWKAWTAEPDEASFPYTRMPDTITAYTRSH